MSDDTTEVLRTPLTEPEKAKLLEFARDNCTENVPTQIRRLCWEIDALKQRIATLEAQIPTREQMVKLLDEEYAECMGLFSAELLADAILALWNHQGGAR